jgi:hypothetical protein
MLCHVGREVTVIEHREGRPRGRKQNEHSGGECRWPPWSQHTGKRDAKSTPAACIWEQSRRKYKQYGVSFRQACMTSPWEN